MISAAGGGNRRLVERESTHSNSAMGCLERTDRAIRMRGYIDWPLVDSINQGSQLGEFALHPVCSGIVTFATASIDRVDGELLFQGRHNQIPAAMIRSGSVNQQYRRAMTMANVAYDAPIFRSNPAH